jgi:hypothetical protein
MVRRNTLLTLEGLIFIDQQVQLELVVKLLINEITYRLATPQV